MVLQALGVICLVAFTLRFLFLLPFRARRKRDVVIREIYGPGRSFSILVPADWQNKSEGEFFFVGGDGDGPVLAGAAWHFERLVEMRPFADVRFDGVGAIGVYKQRGREFLLQNGGIGREYVGMSVADRKRRSYVVACFVAGTYGVEITLTTTRKDYRSNRARYLEMFASLRILGVNKQVSDQTAETAPASATLH